MTILDSYVSVVFSQKKGHCYEYERVFETL